jgi:hypothetical protein
MKKIIVTVFSTVISVASNAQDNKEPLIDRSLIFDIVNICGAILFVYVITGFIAKVIKNSFDYRLRNKIIDKSVPENIASQVLQQTDKTDKRQFILQWICILTAIGIGITITCLTMPVGLHSLAIMAFSVAAGFLVYHLFTKEKEK